MSDRFGIVGARPPRSARRVAALAFAVALACGTAAAPASAASSPAPDSTIIGELRGEAAALAPLFAAPLVRRFLAGAEKLPHVADHTLYADSARTHWWTEREALALPDSASARLVRRTLDESFFYDTRYGSPLAYARPLQLLADAGVADVRGWRLLDFGYGTIGHLRLLARLGADAHGVDVDPMLRALYAGETGEVSGDGRRGRVTLHDGQWPANPALVDEVGGGYDLFLSKNTLKNGYVHPAEHVNPRLLVHLGVGDTAYVRALHRLLKPGGYALIYNLCPAPAPPGKPYIPWADGRCPFARDLWEREGFEVLAFDRDDSAAGREMGHALGWDQGPHPMDLEHDLFALYTLVRRRS